MSNRLISRKAQAIIIRQQTDIDEMNTIAASYADEGQDDRTARWVMKKQLQLNSLMSQGQIDELGRQLSECENSEQQRAVVERWIDAYAFEALGQTLRVERQGFAVPLCSKIAERLRYPHTYEKNLEYAESEAIGLAAAYPRHREEIERMFLATPDVCYSIAVCFGDENDLPF